MPFWGLNRRRATSKPFTAETRRTRGSARSFLIYGCCLRPDAVKANITRASVVNAFFLRDAEALGGDLLSRQCEIEGCAVIQFALGLDGSAVGANHVLHNGQAQSGAAGLAGAGFIDAVEALEEPRQVLAGNTLAEVAHEELHPSSVSQAPTMIFLPDSPYFQCVLDQISEDLVNRIAIDEDFLKTPY